MAWQLDVMGSHLESAFGPSDGILALLLTHTCLIPGDVVTFEKEGECREREVNKLRDTSTNTSACLQKSSRFLGFMMNIPKVEGC